MLVNSSVAHFQNYAHETVAQILESLRTFQRAMVFPYLLSKQCGRCCKANRFCIDFSTSMAPQRIAKLY
jgi:hypothetical protein